jgi:hypothetical protein
MSTLYPFVPSQNAAFQFSPILDGATYNATVTWNQFGQRYYLNLAALDGTPVLTIAVVDCPNALPLASLSWANGKVTAVTQQPHGYKIGLTVAVLVGGCAPSAYNGDFFAFVTGPQTLVYPLIANPGGATQIGAVDWIVNLVEGYFETSTLCFRNNQFETNP